MYIKFFVVWLKLVFLSILKTLKDHVLKTIFSKTSINRNFEMKFPEIFAIPVCLPNFS